MEGETLDFHAEMRRLTVQILGATVLDEDMHRDEQVIIEATDALVDGRTSGGRDNSSLISSRRVRNDDSADL